MQTNRKKLVELIDSHQINQIDIPEALQVIGFYPTPEKWQHFFNALFLWLGGLALAASATFFIAYNWAELGRFAKFALVEALIITAFVFYWRYKPDALTAKVSLLVASLFVGVLLALYGQTYQTGADPWQLFFNWALLIAPWVCIARFAALWVLWVALINLSVVLYYQVFPSAFGLLFFSHNAVFWAMFLLNSVVLVVCELLSKKMAWLAEGWALRLFAVAAGAPITVLCLFAIFDSKQGAWPILAWFACMVCLYLFYRKIKPDLFMLAGGCLSGIVIIVSFFIEVLIGNMDVGGFLLLSLLVIGLGSGAAIWLKNVNKEFQA